MYISHRNVSPFPSSFTGVNHHLFAPHFFYFHNLLRLWSDTKYIQTMHISGNSPNASVCVTFQRALACFTCRAGDAFCQLSGCVSALHKTSLTDWWSRANFMQRCFLQFDLLPRSAGTKSVMACKEVKERRLVNVCPSSPGGIDLLKGNLALVSSCCCNF